MEAEAHLTLQRINARRQSTVFVAFGATVAALCLAFVLVGTLGRSLWNSAPEALKFTTYLDYPSTDPQFNANPCYLKKIPDFTEFSTQCLAVDPQKKNVLVIGDSHSVHFMSALRAAHPEVNFLEASASGCRPTLASSGDDHCVALMRFMFDRWLPQSGKSVPAVLMSAKWLASDQQPIEDTLAFLLRLGKTPILLGPSPEFRAKVPLILAYENFLGRPLAVHLVKPEPFTLDRAYRAAPAIRGHYVSTIEPLCPNGICLTRQGSLPLYFDRDHMTVEGAQLALRGLAPGLEP